MYPTAEYLIYKANIDDRHNNNSRRLQYLTFKNG